MTSSRDRLKSMGRGLGYGVPMAFVFGICANYGTTALAAVAIPITLGTTLGGIAAELYSITFPETSLKKAIKDIFVYLVTALAVTAALEWFALLLSINAGPQEKLRGFRSTSEYLGLNCTDHDALPANICVRQEVIQCLSNATVADHYNVAIVQACKSVAEKAQIAFPTVMISVKLAAVGLFSLVKYCSIRQQSVGFDAKVQPARHQQASYTPPTISLTSVPHS